jgi:hypothetical protein
VQFKPKNQAENEAILFNKFKLEQPMHINTLTLIQENGLGRQITLKILGAPQVSVQCLWPSS